jgi:choice-of-anchor C domain-containing protein
MRLNRCVLVLALAMLVGFGAKANIITNGDFSVGTGINDRVLAGATNIFGWTVLANDVDYVGNSYWQSSPGSTRTVDLAGYQPGGIEQTVPTIAGKSYTLTFYLAGNPDGGPMVKLLDVLANYGGSTFASNHYTFDATGYSHENMGWALQTWQFTAVGSTTTLQFVDTDYSNGPRPQLSGLAWNAYGPVVGSINLTEDEDPPPPDPAPEPVSFALLGSGLIGIAYVYRRRHSR